MMGDETADDSLERILVRVREAREADIRGRSAAAAAIESVAAEARRCMTALLAAARPLADSEAAQTVASFGQAERLMEAHLATVTHRSEGHVRASITAQEHCVRVDEAARRITRISATAHVLSINAAVTATRMNDRGPLAAIASQLSEVTRQVSAVSQRIQGHATALATLAPEVTAEAQTWRQEVERFHQEFQGEMRHTRSTLEQVRGAVSSAVTTGETRLATVIQHAQDALSALAPSDQVDTALRTVDTLSRRLGMEAEVARTAHHRLPGVC